MTLLAVLLLSTAAMAQRGKAGMDMSQLNLTEEQKTELKAIRTAAREKAKALRPAEGEAPNREAMRTIKEETQKAMMAVLTTEQRAELEAQRAARKEAWEQVDIPNSTARIISPAFAASRPSEPRVFLLLNNLSFAKLVSNSVKILGDIFWNLEP